MTPGDITQGRRLPDGFHYRDAEPGDYWKQLRGHRRDHGDADGERGKDWDWCVRDPWGSLGTLGSHVVTEHDDGTISVSPSILSPDPRPASEQMGDHVGAIAGPGWHGFLERGVWREV